MNLRDDKNQIDHKTLLYLLHEYSKRFVQPVVQSVNGL